MLSIILFDFFSYKLNITLETKETATDYIQISVVQQRF